MNTNLSTEALNKLKCTTCTLIWLHVHRWKYGIPLQNAQTRFIHMWKFFTAFSRVFHGLFTSFSRSFHILAFCVVFLNGNFQSSQKPWRHDFQNNSDNFRWSKCRTGPLTGKPPSFKPVAPWQGAGNMFFYPYLIRRNVEGDQCMTIAAFHFATQSWCWWEVLAIVR